MYIYKVYGFMILAYEQSLGGAVMIKLGQFSRSWDVGAGQNGLFRQLTADRIVASWRNEGIPWSKEKSLGREKEKES